MAVRVPLTPAIVCKFGKGGTGPRGALNYDAQKVGAELVGTNLEGNSAPEWARQIHAIGRLNRKCKRLVDHVSLSVDSRLGVLTKAQWAQVATTWMEHMGYGDRAYVIHRHVDQKHDHVHIVICRVHADGHVHKDGNQFKRGHAAAVAAARDIDLADLPEREDALANPAPTDTVVRAARRAARRGTPATEPTKLAAIVRGVRARAKTENQFAEMLSRRGVDVELRRRDGGIYGYRLRICGCEEWLSPSKVARDLGWSTVAACLAVNAAREGNALALQAATVVPAKSIPGRGGTTSLEAIRIELRRLRRVDRARLRRSLERETLAIDRDRLAQDRETVARLLRLLLRLLTAGLVELPATLQEREALARRHLLAEIDAVEAERLVTAPPLPATELPLLANRIRRTHDARKFQTVAADAPPHANLYQQEFDRHRHRG